MKHLIRKIPGDIKKRLKILILIPVITLELNMLDMIGYDSSKKCVNIPNKLVLLSPLVKINKSYPNFNQIQEIKSYKDGIMKYHLTNDDNILIGTNYLV